MMKTIFRTAAVIFLFVLAVGLKQFYDLKEWPDLHDLMNRDISAEWKNISERVKEVRFPDTLLTPEKNIPEKEPETLENIVEKLEKAVKEEVIFAKRKQKAGKPLSQVRRINRKNPTEGDQRKTDAGIAAGSPSSGDYANDSVEKTDSVSVLENYQAIASKIEEGTDPEKSIRLSAKDREGLLKQYQEIDSKLDRFLN